MNGMLARIMETGNANEMRVPGSKEVRDWLADAKYCDSEPYDLLFRRLFDAHENGGDLS